MAAQTFTRGDKVEFNTNFYEDEKYQRGIGTVNRVERCRGDECACGAGATVFVTTEDGLTLAYVGKELKPVE